MYPRKTYYKMQKGQPQFKCACFKEVGWSDLRQIYDGCDVVATRCKIIDSTADNDESQREL
jgi:hypothetical protein